MSTHAQIVREWRDAGYRECGTCGVHVHPTRGLGCPAKSDACPVYRKEATPCRG